MKNNIWNELRLVSIRENGEDYIEDICDSLEDNFEYVCMQAAMKASDSTQLERDKAEMYDEFADDMIELSEHIYKFLDKWSINKDNND